MQEAGPFCHIDSVETALDEFLREHKSISTKLIDINDCQPINESKSASYFNSSRYFVQLLRSRKSLAELELIRRACDISSKAFVEAIKISHPYINEHLIEAKFDFDCKIRGSEHLAYIPVVAGGGIFIEFYFLI